MNQAKARTTSARKRSSLENQALVAARALVDRMRTLYRELERLTDAPITLHRALVAIGNEPGLPASQLARLLGMQRPAVSQVLKSLAVRGWIERQRSPDDQRSVKIFPTSDGRQILNATAGRAVGTLQRAVRGLSAQKLVQLAAGLEALLAQLGDEQALVAPVRSKQAAMRARGRKTGASSS